MPPAPERRASYIPDQLPPGAVLDDAEYSALVRAVRDRATIHRARGKRQGVIDECFILTALLSGLRGMELRNLRHGDLRLVRGSGSLFVRQGKGGGDSGNIRQRKSRTVYVPSQLVELLKFFEEWKEARGESRGDDAHVFLPVGAPPDGTSGYSAQGIRGLVERCLKRAGINRRERNCHALRHTYCSRLYRVKRDIRIVQSQAGHASPATSAIYAHVQDTEEQVAAFGDAAAELVGKPEKK